MTVPANQPESPAAAPSRAAKRAFWHVITHRPRLFGCVLLAVAVFFASAGHAEVSSRCLLAWDVGVALYLAISLVVWSRSDVLRMRRHAAELDEGQFTILLLLVTGAMASLVAIALELHAAGQISDGLRSLRILLAGGTILVSWIFLQVIMAQHYAHDYYRLESTGRGLTFPGDTPEPDYWDFLYFAVNLGAAAQTADVVITTRHFRRLALAHSMLSFLFNTTILALAINVGASLL